MQNSGGFSAAWQRFTETAGPAWKKFNDILQRIGHVLSLIFGWIFKLRKVFLAIPVVYGALRLADYNMHNLPEKVGLNLQSSGEFAAMISRESAVLYPLVLTAACLVLMFCSRRSVYPWLISLFTLAVPLLLLLTNIYPA